MRKKIFLIVSGVVLALIIWVFIDYSLAVNTEIPPFVDLSFVLTKESMTDEEYNLVFDQTGLGRVAIDALKKDESSFIENVKRFQAQKQKPVRYRQTFLFFPTTTAEELRDETGRKRMLLLPPLEVGDVLITKSTKTLLYRHGHAALVLKPNVSTIESMMIGTESDILNVDSWRSYPTLLILRPKNNRELAKAAVDFAEKKLLGVPYQLLTGVVKKDKSDMETIDGTHCAHLVWQAYQSAGLDIDTDHGWQVTPHDLAKDDVMEVVFSYGFGKTGLW